MTAAGKRAKEAMTNIFREGPDTSAPPRKEPKPRTQPQPPARQNTKMIAGHFPPEVAAKLRTMAFEEETTIQALLGEALNDLFLKRNRGRVKL